MSLLQSFHGCLKSCCLNLNAWCCCLQTVRSRIHWQFSIWCDVSSWFTCLQSLRRSRTTTEVWYDESCGNCWQRLDVVAPQNLDLSAFKDCWERSLWRSLRITNLWKGCATCLGFLSYATSSCAFVSAIIIKTDWVVSNQYWSFSLLLCWIVSSKFSSRKADGSHCFCPQESHRLSCCSGLATMDVGCKLVWRCRLLCCWCLVKGKKGLLYCGSVFHLIRDRRLICARYCLYGLGLGSKGCCRNYLTCSKHQLKPWKHYSHLTIHQLPRVKQKFIDDVQMNSGLSNFDQTKGNVLFQSCLNCSHQIDGSICFLAPNKTMNSYLDVLPASSKGLHLGDPSWTQVRCQNIMCVSFHRFYCQEQYHREF